MKFESWPAARVFRLAVTALLLALLAGMSLSKAHGGFVGRALARVGGYGYGYGGGGYDSTCGRLARPNMQTVDGNPLKVCVRDDGSTEARYDTSQSDALPYGGFWLELSGASGATQIGTMPATQDAPVTGATGTISQVTHLLAQSWDGTTSNQAGTVDQTVSYQPGAQQFRVDYTFTNTTSSAEAIVANAYGGFDLGEGGTASAAYNAGPPKSIMASDPEEGALSGMEAVTPFQHYVLSDGWRWNGVDDSAGVNPADYEPMGVVQWTNHSTTPIAAGRAVTWSVLYKLKQTRGLRAFPYGDILPAGSTSTTTLKYFDPAGDMAGKVVRWSTGDGASGTATTDSTGAATIGYAGSGYSRLTAFVDVNDNGTQDPGERSANAWRFFGDTTRSTPPTPAPAPAPAPSAPAGSPAAAAAAATGTKAASTTGPVAGTPVATLPALAPVTIKSVRLAVLLKRGLRVSTVARRVGTYRWALLLDRKTAHRAHIAAAKTVTVASATATAKKVGASLTATLRPSGKTARRLRRLHKVTFVVQTTVTGAGGAAQTTTKTVTVRR